MVIMVYVMSVVFDGVLVLPCDTPDNVPVISKVPEAMYKARLVSLEGCLVSPKSPSKVRDRDERAEVESPKVSL